ncbi:VOC family protein [Streptomyces sp. NPDC059499]|uniref:VOC family protein n=1 Tax=Streptomyces sp. NPDC059499 TaxID=3346852 RepID=UPI00369C8D79
MITTDFVPGSPCWLDLGAGDVAASAAFYGAVFGWEFENLGPGAEEYGFFKLDGKAVSGLGRLTEEGARSAWMIYFHTPDATATTETVRRLGGTVRVEPTDADGAGRMAQYTDPHGAQFAVWQPGTMNGLEVADQPGSLCWTEMYTTDAAGAKDFYGNLFGWTTQDMPLPGGGGTYSMITPAGQVPERMHGGLMEMPADQLVATGGQSYWHPVFASADCDSTVERVRANGGSVLMGPEDAEGVGRLALCADPAGADFVVLTPVPM